MPKVLTLLRHNIKNVENKIRVISLARLSPTLSIKNLTKIAIAKLGKLKFINNLLKFYKTKRSIWVD